MDAQTHIAELEQRNGELALQVEQMLPLLDERARWAREALEELREQVRGQPPPPDPEPASYSLGARWASALLAVGPPMQSPARPDDSRALALALRASRELQSCWRVQLHSITAELRSVERRERRLLAELTAERAVSPSTSAHGSNPSASLSVSPAQASRVITLGETLHSQHRHSEALSAPDPASLFVAPHSPPFGATAPHGMARRESVGPDGIYTSEGLPREASSAAPALQPPGRPLVVVRDGSPRVPEGSVLLRVAPLPTRASPTGVRVALSISPSDDRADSCAPAFLLD
ncbi:hypothetical protein T492DRAFT_1045179 [Pavlovales sp. CCMP2436]|nr:hypothetical protein T492DRAFT_1045179 [Pavlovales sp. CCMP2436]|mmetsp:Transcript_50310/g.117932  ORF Transcript_50310/g.117932 Transcript_50310/m.117932 type:complete len:291 (+) Transcript_50310:116-988(+)